MKLPYRETNHLKKILKRFPLLLVIIAIAASLASSAFALRANYLGAKPLLEAVFVADQQNGNIEKALYDLRQYTHSHMNVDLSQLSGTKPPIQLKNRYEQLVEAEKKRVLLTNEVIVRQAENVCASQFSDNANRIGRTQCVQEYILANGTKEQVIPDSLYKFDFVSPRWSPDLAGWSIVALLVSCIFGLLRMLGWIIFKAFR